MIHKNSKIGFAPLMNRNFLDGLDIVWKCLCASIILTGAIIAFVGICVGSILTGDIFR